MSKEKPARLVRMADLPKNSAAVDDVHRMTSASIESMKEADDRWLASVVPDLRHRTDKPDGESARYALAQLTTLRDRIINDSNSTRVWPPIARDVIRAVALVARSGVLRKPVWRDWFSRVAVRPWTDAAVEDATELSLVPEGSIERAQEEQPIDHLWPAVVVIDLVLAGMAEAGNPSAPVALPPAALEHFPPRVQRAARYITEWPGKTGETIAADCEYPDPSQFRRDFREKLKPLGFYRPEGSQGYYPPAPHLRHTSDTDSS